MAAPATTTPIPTTDKPPRPRRWIPLSLRMFAAIMVVGGMVAGWEGVQNYRQRLTVSELVQRGWSVRFRSLAPEWVLSWAGPARINSFGKVVAVYTDDNHASRSDVEWTHGLCCGPYVPDPVSNAQMVQLSKLTTLEVLSLNDSQVGDAGLAHLSGLTALRRLSLKNTRVTDAGIADLQRALPGLKIEK